MARLICAAVAALAAWLPVSSQACAACYGDSSAPMSRGLTWAVVALASIIACVLVAVTAFFVHIGRHSAPANPPSGENKEI